MHSAGPIFKDKEQKHAFLNTICTEFRQPDENSLDKLAIFSKKCDEGPSLLTHLHLVVSPKIVNQIYLEAV